MPSCCDHDPRDSFDIYIRDLIVEKVAHGINEDYFGFAPTQWLSQFFRNQTQVKSLFVGMALDATKTLRERFRVTVFAPGADLGAPANGIPCGVRPFDV